MFNSDSAELGTISSLEATSTEKLDCFENQKKIFSIRKMV